MRTLNDNQKIAVEKLSRLKVGALFMECGTGKTFTACELINSVENIDYLLWICPCQTKKNVIEEMAKCNLKYTPDIVGVESIGQSDRVYMEVFEKVTSHKNVFIVVDESLKIKNYRAKRTSRILKLGEKSNYRLILNGTPITKNIVDIYQQMLFLSPKILNCGYAEYRDRYCEYYQIVKKNIYNKKQQIVKTVITGFDNVDHLLSVIHPYVYQCDLELNVEQEYNILNWNMTPDESYDYEELKGIIFSEAQDKFEILGALNRLQHYYCVCEDKFKTIKGLVDDKTLFFCKFIKSKEALEKRYPNNKVLTYGTGSLGLNLQQFNKIIYFDKTFDYAYRLQSEARIYRTGQKDNCTYYDLTGDIGLERMIDDCIYRKERLVTHFKKNIKNPLKEL